jgi:uncharacterized protein YjeT (DUF2065 family)
MKKAFTLIETTIYVALAVLVASGTIYYLLTVSQTKAKVTAILEVQQVERLIFSEVQSLVSQADNINWSASITDQDRGLLALDDGLGQMTVFTVGSDGRLVIRRGANESPLHDTTVQISRWHLTKLDDETVMVDLEVKYLEGLAPLGCSASWRSAFSLNKL